MSSESKTPRVLGLWGATGIGVGAIVGGGILALAGAAFAATGPGAVVAFALNGAIAFITALSFAEMSTKFPESGGTYTFAKKVLSVQSAFTLGWVVWFASIVAGALYALGFAFYAAIGVRHLWAALGGEAPEWITGRLAVTFLAGVSALFYALSLLRRSSGGGNWETIGKIILFAVLILGGIWALAGRPAVDIGASLKPFFSSGAVGIFKAMGFTFIALQGFDLIAAVAGEVRDPGRNLPKAMFISLGVALAIYLPLLFIISTVGVNPGQTIAEMSAAEPETVMASAVYNYLGPVGLWLVIVAAILAMLSALRANLLAASRMAMSMAEDRTLPRLLARMDKKRGTPGPAIMASFLLIAIIIIAVPDVASVGAAASLIFLVSFTLVHWTNILARRRAAAGPDAFIMPWFPLVPLVGILSCGVLAIFQGIAVPSAGAWVACGVIIYVFLFARRAKLFDASMQAYYPDLIRLRGKRPFVLVPVAGGGKHDVLRARLLGSLGRIGQREVTFLRIMPEDTGDKTMVKVARELKRLADDETRGRPESIVIRSSAVAEEITSRAAESDLVILGLQRLGRRRKVIGEMALRISRDTSCALIMISRRG